MAVSATKALLRAAESGEQLNLPLWMSTVEQRGAVFRRGHLVLVAGPPGAGKSRVIQKLTADINAPTLYFSADQDPWITTTTLASCLTGDDNHTVGMAFATGNGGYYDGALARSSVSYCFDSNPSLEDIGLEVDAWVETWDEYPEVIVVDTLRNVEGESDKSSDLFVMSELHGLARRTQACVVVLVHQSEANVKTPARPLPRKDIQNKISEFPDMAVAVAYDPEAETLWMAVVKTREGKADIGADHPIAIKADFSRMIFGSMAGWASN